MARHATELHRTAKGPVMNHEDWWRLVIDTESGRLYVEHEWAHTDVRKTGGWNNGKIEISVEDFLKDGEQTAKWRLEAILSGVFGSGIVTAT
jgi:hypothetical protein